MTRIQHILDKAQRDGALHRVRPLTDQSVAAGIAPIELPPLVHVPPPPAPEVDTKTEPAPAAHRSASGVRISPWLVAAGSTDVVAAEQYRSLRTRILHAENGAVGAVLVTSPGRNDGKSVTAANLGLAMAQEFQRRICVVDANLRSPQQQRLFGLPDGPGLADLLVGRATLDDVFVAVEDYHLTVIPAGESTANPAELLGTTTMRRTMEMLRSRFDCVVIDSPSATPLADVGIMVPLVDHVLLVVRAGRTSKPAIHDAITAVEPGKLLGIVLNEAA